MTKRLVRSSVVLGARVVRQAPKTVDPPKCRLLAAEVIVSVSGCHQAGNPVEECSLVVAVREQLRKRSGLSICQSGEPGCQLILKIARVKALICSVATLEEKRAGAADITNVVRVFAFDRDESVPDFPSASAFGGEAQRRIGVVDSDLHDSVELPLGGLIQSLEPERPTDGVKEPRASLRRHPVSPCVLPERPTGGVKEPRASFRKHPVSPCVLVLRVLGQSRLDCRSKALVRHVMELVFYYRANELDELLHESRVVFVHAPMGLPPRTCPCRFGSGSRECLTTERAYSTPPARPRRT